MSSSLFASGKGAFAPRLTRLTVRSAAVSGVSLYTLTPASYAVCQL